MKSKTIKAKIDWTGNEHTENPDYVEIGLSEEDVVNIQKARSFLKENPKISDVRMDVDVYSMTNEDGEEVDFQSDVNKLVVSLRNVHYYGQHKYESSTQIESEDLEKEIFN
jgi:hypothetical protein